MKAVPLVGMIILLMAKNGMAEPLPNSTNCPSERFYIESLFTGEYQARVEPDFSCFVTVDKANMNGSLIVDTRDKNDWENVHISGSINLPQRTLLNATHLKNRPLLVVDKGINPNKNAQLCGLAKEQGFDQLQILIGGISSWKLSGHSVNGSPLDVAQLYLVDQNHFLEAAFRNDITIIADSKSYSFLKRVLPADTVLKQKPKKETWNKAVLSTLDTAGYQQALFPVVLVSENAEALRLQKQDWKNLQGVFLLNASIQDLVVTLTANEQMQQKRKQIPDRYRCRG